MCVHAICKYCRKILAILLPFLFDDWFIADIRLFISHNFCLSLFSLFFLS